MGDLSPTFKGRGEGQSVLFALAVSQVLSIQNNQYAKVVYYGVAYSEETRPFGGKLHNTENTENCRDILCSLFHCEEYSDHSLELG